MQKLILSFILFWSSFSIATPPSHFYSVVSYNCMLENGIQIFYSHGKNENRVTAVKRTPTYAEKLLWNEGGRYFENTNTSEIIFTGHRPSAGPVLDPMESDYLFRLEGKIDTSEVRRYEVELLENKALTKFRKVSAGECEIEVERMF